jgi:hypothetical protein
MCAGMTSASDKRKYIPQMRCRWQRSGRRAGGNTTVRHPVRGMFSMHGAAGRRRIAREHGAASERMFAENGPVSGGLDAYFPRVNPTSTTLGEKHGEVSCHVGNAFPSL